MELLSLKTGIKNRKKLTVVSDREWLCKNISEYDSYWSDIWNISYIIHYTAMIIAYSISEHVPFALIEFSFSKPLFFFFLRNNLLRWKAFLNYTEILLNLFSLNVPVRKIFILRYDYQSLYRKCFPVFFLYFSARCIIFLLFRRDVQLAHCQNCFFSLTE